MKEPIKKWWRQNGCTRFHEVVDLLGDNYLMVATLQTNNGWQTYPGKELVRLGSGFSEGELMDSPKGGYGCLHTKAVADVISTLRTLTEDSARTAAVEFRLFLKQNRERLTNLDTTAPEVHAAGYFHFRCNRFSEGRLTKTDLVDATVLKAHQLYFSQLIGIS